MRSSPASVIIVLWAVAVGEEDGDEKNGVDESADGKGEDVDAPEISHNGEALSFLQNVVMEVVTQAVSVSGEHVFTRNSTAAQ